ncbi:hypothetical protein MBLNU457_g0578t3 [Dothideomycetes sp. NU457]
MPTKVMPSNSGAEGPLYEEEIDFEALALVDPEFAKLYRDSGNRIDFQDPNALQQLTKSLLKRDFDLSLTLPPDRLCPPVPVRYNYIYWIQRLIESTSSESQSLVDSEQRVTGLDIGTGASSIYALLACRTRPSWTMYASDIDSHSISFARNNVELNNLASRITIYHSSDKTALIPLEDLGVDRLDFVLCNPPFYSSLAEMTESNNAKSRPPSATCTGSENEMICPGGDIGFVSRILDESLLLRGKVQWYTSMLGKLSSVHALVAKLKENNIDNYAVTSLRAGKKTRRWAVGWSFDDCRPSSAVCRGKEVSVVALPLPTEDTIKVDSISAKEIATRLDVVMAGLDMRWKWDEANFSGVGSASGNVWSRSARRKRKRAEMESQNTNEATGSSGEISVQALAMTVRITVVDAQADVRWLRGHDGLLFESFCGMLKRALRDGNSTRVPSQK